ncbi:MAG: AAA family ATPase [Niameybacter sp.]|uniref:AAA family ATPase n=1 Tax=Niameybacter sp. TaxID=2033640 RepID=UPI002FCBAFA4
MKKRLFLVGSPPASGKTFVSKKLASKLNNPVYLDKDTIIPLSMAAYKAANEPYNRDSAFFNTYLRDPEYVAILDVAFESLEFNDNVIVNAPFTKEFNNETYVSELKAKLAEVDTELVMVWVYCELETIHQRMIERASDRDTWKLENWDEYVKTKDNSKPTNKAVVVIENKDEESVERQLQDAFF